MTPAAAPPQRQAAIGTVAVVVLPVLRARRVCFRLTLRGGLPKASGPRALVTARDLHSTPTYSCDRPLMRR
jgi:hypothetical protein